MTTTWPIRHRLSTILLALTLVAGGCAASDGDDTIETTGDGSGETSGSGGDEGGGGAGADTEQIALGEITDPSETDDPDSTTPDTTPQSDSHLIRVGVQEPLTQGDWRIADERATEALERTDLAPDFRLELEAYRDLARAAEVDDEVAADDAVDRIEVFEPDFVDDLAISRVLPESVLPRAERVAATQAEAESTGAENERAADTSDVGVADKLAAVEMALVIEDWLLADRLASELLSDGKLTAEDTTRARTYGDLAQAHIKDDTAAIARATETVASLNPDLVLKLSPEIGRLDSDPTARTDG